MSRSQRRKVYIDAKVQGALARRIMLHWVIFLMVASLAAFMLQVLSNPFRPIADHARDLWQTQGPFLVVMLFLLPVFVVDTIKLSHRFAGPIFSLRRTIGEIAEGKTPRKLKFRSDDFWQELADDFNAMLARLGVLNGDEASAGNGAAPDDTVRQRASSAKK